MISISALIGALEVEPFLGKYDKRTDQPTTIRRTDWVIVKFHSQKAFKVISDLIVRASNKHKKMKLIYILSRYQALLSTVK